MSMPPAVRSISFRSSIPTYYWVIEMITFSINLRSEINQCAHHANPRAIYSGSWWGFSWWNILHLEIELGLKHEKIIKASDNTEIWVIVALACNSSNMSTKGPSYTPLFSVSLTNSCLNHEFLRTALSRFPLLAKRFTGACLVGPAEVPL